MKNTHANWLDTSQPYSPGELKLENDIDLKIYAFPSIWNRFSKNLCQFPKLISEIELSCIHLIPIKDQQFCSWMTFIALMNLDHTISIPPPSWWSRNSYPCPSLVEMAHLNQHIYSVGFFPGSTPFQDLVSFAPAIFKKLYFSDFSFFSSHSPFLFSVFSNIPRRLK